MNNAPHDSSDSTSPRVLIVRLSAIGDVVHTLPVACAMRDRWPGAQITWVAERPGAALLEGHPALDELIVLDRGWLKRPGLVWQLRRRLHSRRFDVAIDAQGLSKSAIVAWLSGARRRIGFDGCWGREISRWLNNELVPTPPQHVIHRNLQLLGPLGIEAPTIRFDVPEPPEAQHVADRVVRASHLIAGFAMLTPGAGWASKRWPPDRFAAVIRRLAQSHDIRTLVVWGNDQEREWAEQIVADSPGDGRFAPRLSLLELAAVARRARLFVGADTGPMHLAAAVDTPCVALFGPWPGERHGPLGPQHEIVQRAWFEGTTRQRRHAPTDLIEAISVDDVCAACRRILEHQDREVA